VQRRPVALAGRKRGERLVLLDDALEPARPVGAHRLEVLRVHGVADHAVDAGLLVAPLLRQAEAADQQEQQHADERQQENQQQPRHGRRGLAVAAGHEDECHDVDDHGRDQDDRPEGSRFGDG
jgi:hypothetical protein